MQEQITAIVTAAKQAVDQAKKPAEIEQLRVQYLGKKGQLTEILKTLSQVTGADKPILGKAVNLAKQELISLFENSEQKLSEIALQQQLTAEKIDVTLPGRGQNVGTSHPVTQVRERLTDIFTKLGFAVAEGPEIEDDYHNFGALNFPDHHPARDTQDTFFFDDGSLLRTHTSPVQIRVMENQKPPFRVITPGRVYRRDSDPTHTPMFNQMEVLMVDKNVTFAHLKAFLQDFLNAFFEQEIALRFRPSFFPFTEPSAEVDIGHLACDGKGCRLCGFSGWLEVLGCGMVHPNVLRNVKVDPEEYTGFAIGMGLDRLAMLRYHISDLRLMFENDLRFLQQF